MGRARALIMASALGLGLGTPVRSGAAPAPAPAAVAAAAHLERGRQAYQNGDYESCLEEMMAALVTEARPGGPEPGPGVAREYLRLASEGLLARERRAISRQRRDILRAYDAALGEARQAALRWNDWIFHGRRAMRKDRWAFAYDRFSAVLSENARHEDAAGGLGEARLGLAAVLAGDAPRHKKDELLYVGLMAFDWRDHAEARRALQEALDRPDLRGELDDERIQWFLDRLPQENKPGKPELLASLPGVPSPPSARAAPRPPGPGSGPPVKARPAPAAPRVGAAAVRAPRPGQYAHAQGSALRREGRLEEAVELFARAVEEAPGVDEFRRELVKARHDLEESRRLGKAEAQKLYTLGILLYGQGRPAEALAQWRKALRLDPGHPYAERALRHVEQELAEEKP